MKLRWAALAVVLAFSALMPRGARAQASQPPTGQRPAGSLGQNYPNPFNPTTTIHFTLPTEANVTLRVLDLTGKVVRMEISGEPMTAGEHTHLVDASELASGTYIYMMTAVQPNGTTTTLSKKMTLNK